MSYEMNLLSTEIFARLSREPRTTLCSLSAQLRVSKRTCETAIRSCLGATFRDLQIAALSSAIHDILHSQPTIAIKELAYCVGFKSPRSFARAVRNMYGKSPKELRTLISSQNLRATEQLGQLRTLSFPSLSTQLLKKLYS